MNTDLLPGWLQPMRVQDREIVDSQRVWGILRGSEVCRVAFCGENWPYVVPMNFGILDDKLYFHCASEGTKLNLLKGNANVCFEVEADVEVLPGETGCNWSVRYQSVIGLGRASVVEDPLEKRAGLAALASRYVQLGRHSDREIQIPEKISSATVVFRIDILSLTGKASSGN